MTQRIIKLSEITESEIQLVHKVLSSGDVIAYPTDTIYGLGVDIYHRKAVANLQRLKNRNDHKPVSILYSDVESLLVDFPHLNSLQRKIVRELMPGRITLLLPIVSEDKFPAFVIDNGFIGIRVVDLPALNRLLADYRHPISTTSINPAGAKPATSVKEILDYFNAEIPVIIDNGTNRDPKPSTIIRLLQNDWEIVREAAISETEIARRLRTN